MKKKDHIPAPGKSAGLRGEALCGRMATYRTGDHALIRRLALQGDGDGWCLDCLKEVRS